jgi:subtilisin family serine protease
MAVAVAIGAGPMSAPAHAKSALSDPALEGEILLRLRSTTALAPLLAKYRLEEISQFGSRPIYRLAVTGASSVEAIIDALEFEVDVIAAEANRTLTSPEARRNAAWAVGKESDYAQQWAPQAMRLDAAHELSTGKGVRVAVLDTGVDRLHIGLDGRLLPGWDFVDDDNDPSEAGSTGNPGFGHGTHVTGLVALAAPGAQIMPVRALDADGMGNVWVLAEALLYAVDPDRNPGTDDGARVINLSLGTINRTDILRAAVGLATCAIVDAAAEELGLPVAPDIDITDPGYDDDKDRCGNFKGAVVIAAAGNDASKRVRQYPAAAGVYGMLSIGASDATGSIASFSNYGSWVDILAPGSDITSFVPGGGYATWSGTSMAAPLVAGTAALLIARRPTLSPRAVTRQIERSSAELCDEPLRQVDAAAALGNAAPGGAVCP